MLAWTVVSDGLMRLFRQRETTESHIDQKVILKMYFCLDFFITDKEHLVQYSFYTHTHTHTHTHTYIYINWFNVIAKQVYMLQVNLVMK